MKSVFLVAVLVLIRGVSCAQQIDWNTQIKNKPVIVDTTNNLNFTGIDSFKYLDTMRLADLFPGADCGAKINAADLDLGSSVGEIWVSQNCGVAWTTAVNISLSHTLRFIQGGIYSTSAKVTVGQSACLVGSPGGSTKKPANLQMAAGANLPVLVAFTGDQACLIDMVLDGNKANNPTGGVLLKISTSQRDEIRHSMLINSKSHGLWIAGTNGLDTVVGKIENTIFLSNDGDCIYATRSSDWFIGDATELEACGLQGASLPSVNTNGTAVTWVSGPKWSTDSSLVGTQIMINGVFYTVQFIGSPTSLTLVTSAGAQNAVTLQWGWGIEFNNANAWRVEHSDFGTNAEGGASLYGTTATNGSANNIFVGNQFANIGPDIKIIGYDPVGGGYVAQATTIVGNQFVSNTSSLGAANTFNSIGITDGGAENITGNYFSAKQGSAPARARAISVVETAAGRDQSKIISGNTFDTRQGSFGVAAQTCNTQNFGQSCNAGNVGQVLIEDTTLGAPAASITFSSIPSNYKGLLIVFQGRSDAAATSDVAVLQFNGDTGNNYDAQNVQGSNVTASAASSAGLAIAGFGTLPGANAARSGIAAAISVTIPNYANTTFEKSFNGMGGFADSTSANNVVELRSGTWRSTAAITSIKLFPNAGTNFTAGTRATLYGLN